MTLMKLGVSNDLDVLAGILDSRETVSWTNMLIWLLKRLSYPFIIEVTPILMINSAISS